MKYKWAEAHLRHNHWDERSVDNRPLTLKIVQISDRAGEKHFRVCIDSTESQCKYRNIIWFSFQFWLIRRYFDIRCGICNGWSTNQLCLPSIEKRCRSKVRHKCRPYHRPFPFAPGGQDCWHPPLHYGVHRLASAFRTASATGVPVAWHSHPPPAFGHPLSRELAASGREFPSV